MILPSNPSLLNLSTLLLVLATLLWPGPSSSEETITLAPGSEGADSSYYTFFPLLVRGNYTTMYAFTSTETTGESHSMETFLKFDLPADLLDLDVPPGPGEVADVLDAFLVMVFAFTFAHDGDPSDPDGELRVHEVLEDWDESTMNYANHPDAGPYFTSISGVETFGSLVFDVTESVRDWAVGTHPNYGFKISNPSPEPIGFHSFESAVAPSLKAQLIITVPDPASGLGLGVATLALMGRRRSFRRCSSTGEKRSCFEWVPKGSQTEPR